ncbi:MAG TPA: hypothetical protein VGP72_13090 [Planctomycetota bacterium]|jgi:hypothetical protein
MIGGHDLTYPIEIGPELALYLVYEVASRIWPECVVEDSEHRRPLSRVKFGPQLAGVSEIMIFRDRASRELWRKRGASDETEDTMVYALAGDGELTLAVCDPKKGDIKQIVSAVQQSMGQVTRARDTRTQRRRKAG